MNRNEFLRRASAAVAGGVLGACFTTPSRAENSAAAPKFPDPLTTWGPGDPAYYGGLKLGMHSYTLRNFQLADAIRITKELGLRYIGLNPRHLALTLPPEKLREAKAQIEGEGLTIMAVGVIGFKPNDTMAPKVFDYASIMGMKVILASPEREALDILDPLVERTGIRIAIHNHGPSDKWPTPDKLMEAIKDHHPGIGACVDWGHYKRAGVEAHDAIRTIGDRVYDCHVKDVNQAAEAGKSVVMGTGVVNVKEALRALIDIKFQGHAAIEYEATPDNPVEGIRQSLEHIRKCFEEIKSA